ncbi:MAG: Cysteine-tRNA ligase [candidate division CPR2 bacterium GW2011_GWC1_39_9]|uniref:Cysteine--tRNA ligase n=1 Tax=candidate division CPR2 bacterium GW2011_GWC2_39_10 TaxID=1618345 RepID=A0A0G0P9Q1_UNCC2|nr:MAG: Cysteine-tRNA ligase [candidate division CPR2 bacterium GW2011_GWC2_39_10]KKR34524.1 MAG: Cysteine-tRNA ligase [candidate division CPR2 bacterium GW2011_GWC1_39_9]KKT34864.1 MAG: Cysteine-tRNA ligase [Parcubacteria group bacterium GW2011_GWA2_44_12]
MNDQILIYNTLSRKKERFIPKSPDEIKMYVCGPTVYDFSHLGHAKGYVSLDVVRRYLSWSGFDVIYVQNFTDVGHLTDDADEGEDKIEKRAKESKVGPMELVDKFINAYFNDFRALNVLDPDIAPRPSKHIEEIIEFVEALIKKGFAYEIMGSVYFDVTKFKDYGKLSGRTLEKAKTGTRIEARSEKRNPEDFALWIKAEPEHILKWDSPWSVGYPGWHIECSVMSQKYLGNNFDIHGGGSDNIFPHNEDEIAQSESLTGEKMANYWLHWGMVKIEGEKMSKSKGNSAFVSELLKNHDPMVIRLAILKSHYRSIIDFSEKLFTESAKNLDSIYTVLALLQEVETEKSQAETSSWLGEARQGFISAMNDDFNTPLALSSIFDFTKKIKANLEKISITQALEIQAFYLDLDAVLGLGLDKVRPSKYELDEYLLEKINEREDARERKDWQTADRIRDELLKEGIELEDTASGVKYKKL